jgi:hypothetical protein
MEGRLILAPISAIELLKEYSDLDNGKKVQAERCQVWLCFLSYAVDVPESFDSLSQRILEASKASQL